MQYDEFLSGAVPKGFRGWTTKCHEGYTKCHKGSDASGGTSRCAPLAWVAEGAKHMNLPATKQSSFYQTESIKNDNHKLVTETSYGDQILPLQGAGGWEHSLQAWK
jgi:hypothetical protein